MKKIVPLIALLFLGACQYISDADKDGIADKHDECPNTYGLEEFNGCPDSDGDGIPDKEDDCPDDYGLEEFNGCPDSDGDGVPDFEDECPDTPGLKIYDGCENNDYVEILVSDCFKRYSITQKEINYYLEFADLELNSVINMGLCNMAVEYLLERRKSLAELERIKRGMRKAEANMRELDAGYVISCFKGSYGHYIVVAKNMSTSPVYYLMQVLSRTECETGGTLKFDETLYNVQSVFIRDEPHKINATLFKLKLIDFSRNRDLLENQFKFN